jgi:hypothetical protein
VNRDESNSRHIPDYQALDSQHRTSNDWGPVVATLYALILAAVLSFIAWAWLGAMQSR